MKKSQKVPLWYTASNPISNDMVKHLVSMFYIKQQDKKNTISTEEYLKLKHKNEE